MKTTNIAPDLKILTKTLSGREKKNFTSKHSHLFQEPKWKRMKMNSNSFEKKRSENEGKKWVLFNNHLQKKEEKSKIYNYIIDLKKKKEDNQWKEKIIEIFIDLENLLTCTSGKLLSESISNNKKEEREREREIKCKK